MSTMTDRTASMAVTSRGIRIGIATVPRQRIEATPDAERIQKALLVKPADTDRYVGWALAVAGLAVIAMHFMGWLPGGGA